MLTPEPKSYTDKMLGLGQEVWKDIDPLEYIRKERVGWDKKYKKRWKKSRLL